MIQADHRTMGAATYQDVLDAPEHMVAELVDGELHLQPRPGQPHTEAASVLGMLIGGAYRLGRGGPGGWWIQDEPELHLGPQVLVPDLAGWRRGDTQLDLRAAWVEVAPAWCARSCLGPPVASTVSGSSRSTPSTGSGAPGSSIRSSVPARCSSSCRSGGPWWPCTAGPSRSGAPLRRGRAPARRALGARARAGLRPGPGEAPTERCAVGQGGGFGAAAPAPRGGRGRGGSRSALTR